MRSDKNCAFAEYSNNAKYFVSMIHLHTVS